VNDSHVLGEDLFFFCFFYFYFFIPIQQNTSVTNHHHHHHHSSSDGSNEDDEDDEDDNDLPLRQAPPISIDDNNGQDRGGEPQYTSISGSSDRARGGESPPNSFDDRDGRGDCARGRETPPPCLTMKTTTNGFENACPTPFDDEDSAGDGSGGHNDNRGEETPHPG
jgi:hypothetical protein